jgi:hypothetical protein
VLAPGEEAGDSMQAGHAGVFVADVGGEVFEEPPVRLVASVGNDCRHDEVGRGRGDGARGSGEGQLARLVGGVVSHAV